MSLPPLAQLTPNNNGPAVITVGYALIVVTILFSIIRVLTTLSLKRQFGWDDSLLLIAVALGLAQTVVTEKSAVFGLGKHFDRLTAHQLDRYYKYSYTANLLWVLTQTAAKSSVVHLMSRLAPTRGGKNTYLATHAGIFAWGFFSIFALAFQCDVPHPWIFARDRCAGEGALWYPVIIFNIITDGVLSFLIAPTVWKLQMPTLQRATVIALFAVRLVVCAFSIGQLALLIPALKKDDFTRKLVLPVIFGQIVMNLSILAAAAPSLHRFLNEMHSGKGFGATIPTSQYELSQGTGKNGSKTWTKVKSAVKKRSTTNMTGREKTIDEEPMDNPTFRPETNRTHNLITSDHPRRNGTRSETSADGSEDMIIRHTKEYAVQYEDGTPAPQMNGRVPHAM